MARFLRQDWLDENLRQDNLPHPDVVPRWSVEAGNWEPIEAKNTYNVRKELKDLGAKWDAKTKKWWVLASLYPEALAIIRKQYEE